MKFYKIIKTRGDREPTVIIGTLSELIDHHSNTLQTGASYAHEKGNKKISLKPKTIEGLVKNLNNAVNNSAANGYSTTFYDCEPCAETITQ